MPQEVACKTVSGKMPSSVPFTNNSISNTTLTYIISVPKLLLLGHLYANIGMPVIPILLLKGTFIPRTISMIIITINIFASTTMHDNILFIISILHSYVICCFESRVSSSCQCLLSFIKWGKNLKTILMISFVSIVVVIVMVWTSLFS